MHFCSVQSAEEIQEGASHLKFLCTAQEELAHQHADLGVSLRLWAHFVLSCLSTQERHWVEQATLSKLGYSHSQAPGHLEMVSLLGFLDPSAFRNIISNFHNFILAFQKCACVCACSHMCKPQHTYVTIREPHPSTTWAHGTVLMSKGLGTHCFILCCFLFSDFHVFSFLEFLCSISITGQLCTVDLRNIS